MTVQAQSEESRTRTYTFQNAPVTAPILSIGKLTDDDNDVLFQTRGGNIIHVSSGEEIAFVRRHGVYFIKLNIDWRILQPEEPETAAQDSGNGWRP